MIVNLIDPLIIHYRKTSMLSKKKLVEIKKCLSDKQSLIKDGLKFNQKKIHIDLQILYGDFLGRGCFLRLLEILEKHSLPSLNYGMFSNNPCYASAFQESPNKKSVYNRYFEETNDINAEFLISEDQAKSPISQTLLRLNVTRNYERPDYISIQLVISDEIHLSSDALYKIFKELSETLDPTHAFCSLRGLYVSTLHLKQRRVFADGLFWLQYYSKSETEAQGGKKAILQNPYIHTKEINDGLLLKVGSSPYDGFNTEHQELLVRATEAMPPTKYNI